MHRRNVVVLQRFNCANLPRLNLSSGHILWYGNTVNKIKNANQIQESKAIMISIRTKAVYSKPAAPELLQELHVGLPEKYATLSEHQALTLRHLRDPDVDIVFNTAMTGDGKSLAAYLPVLKAQSGDGSALAMYPTNALIQDQLRQVKNYQRDFATGKQVAFMDSQRLSELTAEIEYLERKGDAIRHIINAEILLTNPDIFHYIMNFQYYDPGKAIENLPGRVIKYFETFIFDEFHVFQIPQVVAVLNAMLFIHYQTRKQQDSRKFLFLSATPHAMLRQHLERSGMQYRIVNGVYRHSDDTVPGWRKILNSTVIHFIKQTSDVTIEGWIREHVQTILDFYDQHPGSKGAIIVNSPMTAKRIKAFFQELAQSGSFPWSFAEHTGLTKEEGALSKDLLIGTSTVDIGVDFEVNFLLFESLDEGSFIQRLGRLGRHDGYTRDGQRFTFKDFMAYAMLPKYSYERLHTKLQGRTELNREELLELVKDGETDGKKPVFVPVAEFKRYTKRWGVLQTAHILSHTKTQIKTQQAFAEELENAYNRVFGVDMTAMIKRYHARIQDEEGKTIFDELISFRGSSPFDCGVYDATDDSFKTYGLFQIIANTDWHLMTKDEFLSRVKERNLPTARFDRSIAFLHVNGYHAERENFTLQIRKDLSDYGQDYFHKVLVLKGFQLDMRHQHVNEIKRILRRRKVLCLLSKKDRNEIRLKYRLPRLFPVYSLEDARGSVYSMTFGKSALLLETVLEHVPVEHESWIV